MEQPAEDEVYEVQRPGGPSDFDNKALELLRSKGGQEQIRCYYMKDVEVSFDEKSKYTLVAKSDIPAETIILLEQAMLPHVPVFLFPRCAEEVPSCILGAPLGWLPRWFPIFDNTNPWGGEFFMRYLRWHLNACQRLYIMGAMMNHSCVPSCERITREDGLSVVVTNRFVAAGEEISVSYMSSVLNKPLLFRQIFLFHRYGFWCNCDACCVKVDVDREAEMSKLWKKASETRNHNALDLKIDRLLIDLGKTKYPKVYSDDNNLAKKNYVTMHAFLNCTPIVVIILIRILYHYLFWAVYTWRTSLGLPG